MLAIGAGGLEISMALTGQPFRLRMPEIWGIRLTGRLPDWVSANGDGPARHCQDGRRTAREKNIHLAMPHPNAAFALAVTAVFEFPFLLAATQPGMQASGTEVGSRAALRSGGVTTSVEARWRRADQGVTQA
jgi:Aconitase family (aconitate hydratase)